MSNDIDDDKVDQGEPFQRGGTRDVSNGPVKERGCTDVWCLLVFVAAWVGFFIVTFMNAGDGNPQKLYRPRDFRGDFCGLKENWAAPSMNLEKYENLIYVMNVTTAVDQIATQMLCSEVMASRLTPKMSDAERAAYECSCCITPCKNCTSARNVEQYDDMAALEADVKKRLRELTNHTGGELNPLFSSGGANGNLFSSIFTADSPYFVQVCGPSCSSVGVDYNRVYSWQPPGDHDLRQAWVTARQNADVVDRSVFEAFSFEALPYSACPYEDRYCVPWPGVEFEEMDLAAPGHCEFKMSQDVVSVIGNSAASVLEEDGVRAIREDMGSTLGDAVGDFTDTLDAFAITAVCGFLIGLLFLIIMRFCVGCCVWLSVFVVFLLLLAAGGLALLRSGQCAGAGLLDTGKQTTEAVASSAQAAINNGFDVGSEDMTGAGGDYRGAQKRTRSGLSCDQWSNYESYLLGHPDAGLTSNYCRNPGEEAPTIWCYTTDPDVAWETCTPLYVFQDECHEGYEVSNKNMREALKIIAYIIFGIAALWLVIVGCLFKSIRLAIAVNKVAAEFVYTKPAVLFVPMVQTLMAIIWCLLWALSVSFLVSQVADDHVPRDYYASYNEAHGTEDTPGKCTDMVPQGFVWKYEGNFEDPNDPCSGTGGLPRCWRCSPPRYAITLQVWFSFFHYLWNNAFLIAVGQCTIAGACAAWFFAPRGPDKRNVDAVRTGLWNALRYHLGSLALGAFIIAVVQFIRYIMKYFEKQAEAQKNYLCAAILKVAQCCVRCFERFIKFLNRNAYIQIALLGKNFFVSAWNAMMLIMRNFKRFIAVTILGSVTQFVGLVFIVAGTTILGYFIVKGLHPDVSPILPVTGYFIMSYLIGQLYMNVFGLAVDTMLQCFIATEEMGGDDDFVPGALKNLLPAGPKQEKIKAGKEEDDPGSTE